MTLNAVQQFTLKQLNQFTSPALVALNVPPIDAFVTPPVWHDDAVAPAIYIWGSTGRAGRTTFPRANSPSASDVNKAGTKAKRGQVDIWLSFDDSPDNPQGDAMFPVLLGSVIHVLETCVIVDPNTGQGITLTDAQTGEISQLLEFGEELDWDYTTPHGLEDQRWWRYLALIRCTYEEWYQS